VTWSFGAEPARAIARDTSQGLELPSLNSRRTEWGDGALLQRPAVPKLTSGAQSVSVAARDDGGLEPRTLATAPRNNRVFNSTALRAPTRSASSIQWATSTVVPFRWTADRRGR
jgi:hypothetical protein